jgi:hypothetical protein
MIYEKGDLWQMRLEDQRGIDSYCRDRGLTSLFLGEHVVLLWQLGWLKADLVRSLTPLDIPGLLEVASDEDGFVYADERTLQSKPEGWQGSASGLESPSDNLRLFFHPYRYYVLYRIEQLLSLRASPVQVLYKPDLYPRLLQQEIEGFQRFTSQEAFPANIASWTRVAALAILAEPTVHQRLFGQLRFPFHRGFEDQVRQIDAHWTEVERSFSSLGLDQLEKARADLCVSAEMLDPNKDIHTLIRLTRGEHRLTHIKGKLGGAMCLLSMAETFRRVSERLFDTQLKEEDELGFGLTPHGVKEAMYGSQRPLNAPNAVKAQFLRNFGLEFSPRVRWYVEGDTEYGAIREVLGAYSGIELINLSGNVVARRGKGVAFRDDLRADLAANRFSIISIDGDRSDFVRAVREAARANEICGAFFIATPDFEFANFTVSELAMIISQIASETSPAPTSPQEVERVIQGATSSDALLKALRKDLPDVASLVKGEKWGSRLMAYAWGKHENLPTSTVPIKRPIIAALEMALGATSANYLHTRKEFAVDPVSGLPVPRRRE